MPTKLIPVCLNNGFIFYLIALKEVDGDKVDGWIITSMPRRFRRGIRDTGKGLQRQEQSGRFLK
jgi:hypothetical protein